jgi:DNA-binding phage protein
LPGKTGFERQALYKSSSEDDNPRLETLMAVLSVPDLELIVDKRAA